MSYTEHLLSSSSSLKNKGVLIYLGGGEIEGSGSSFWNPLWQLLSPLNMAPVCVSSYSWVIHLSLSHTNSMCHHTFSSSRRVLLFRHITFLVLVESMLPSQLSCLIMFKGSFTSNHPSAVLPVSISCVSPYSFDSPSYITFLCQFHVDDGGYIKALLR
jgi:hypothetical protein